MAFNSFDFLFFMTIVCVVYYILPQKAKKVWLILMSYVFYATWNKYYVLLLLATTVVTYVAAIAIEKFEDKKRIKISKGIIALISILGVLALGVYKYSQFAINNVNRVLNVIDTGKQLDAWDIILPVGISFYVLQSMAYVYDVYKGKIEAEKSLVCYGLFVCFFPQITSGPIGRARELLPQIKSDVSFNVDKIKDGLITFAYGLFLKIVVADNINVLVSPIISSESNYNGMQLLLAMLLFATQIYCDFYGYSLMALGSGRMLQIELRQNFMQPYLQGSVRGFWRGWHISLTSWFTDYIYIPLGGNRKGKIRKFFNTVVVFLISGLWHGAAWHYIIWGGINGFLMVMEDILSNPVRILMNKLKIDGNCTAWKVVKTIGLYLIMTFTWIFFKAESLGSAISISKKIIVMFRPGWFLSEKCFEMFENPYQMGIIIVSLIIVFGVDYIQRTGRDIKFLIFKQQTVYRWAIYLLLLFIIICWGLYGEGIDKAQFIYFEF